MFSASIQNTENQIFIVEN